MDQNLINAGFTIIGALGAWILKTVWEAIKDLKTDLKEISIDVHGNYVRKDDFNKAVDRIEALCTKIFDKLDNKVDK
jgi:plastocyanin domain-containing protein